MAHILKFVAFVKKNSDAPYRIKRMVFDAVILSNLMYGSEVWLHDSAKHGEKTYMMAIKTLLGVRATTTNNVRLMELELPSLVRRFAIAKESFFLN